MRSNHHPFVSAIAIGTGISSCLSISDMLTSLTALKAVSILCNVFLSALTIFPFSDGFELVEDLMNHKEATKSRQKLDSKSEDSFFRVLTNFGMFNFTNESEHLNKHSHQG
jgi:hypothetical protein